MSKEALENSNSLFVAMLHEMRPADEIEAQIIENRNAIAAISFADPTIGEAVAMAKKRLDDYADKANAGKVQSDGRSWKRQIWAAFADYDELLARKARTAR